MDQKSDVIIRTKRPQASLRLLPIDSSLFLSSLFLSQLGLFSSIQNSNFSLLPFVGLSGWFELMFDFQFCAEEWLLFLHL